MRKNRYAVPVRQLYAQKAKKESFKFNASKQNDSKKRNMKKKKKSPKAAG